jgi:hypothetical protein
MYWGEVNSLDPFLATLKNRDGIFSSVSTEAPNLESGIHRLRLKYDWFHKVAEFSVDVHYRGGPFEADVSAPPMDVLDLYGPTGWPTESARIYFGGDDGVVFKNFQVSVTSLLGDFDLDREVDAADYVVWRNSLGSTTFSQADGDRSGTVDVGDYEIWRANFGYTASSGSAIEAGNVVPEPPTFLLLTPAILSAFSLRTQFRLRLA